MPNFVFIASSLDGFIATSDGGLDWLDEIPNPDGDDFGFTDFMNGIDALVMGENTFNKVMSFDAWTYDKPIYVLSSAALNIKKELIGKIERITGTPKQVVAALKKRGHRNLYIDGGLTIQSFREEDLIDEMIITLVPVLLGSGIPLFGKLEQRLYSSHIETTVLNGVLSKSHYKRLRS